MGLLLKHILSHPSGRLSYRRVFPEEVRPFVPGGRREHKASLGLQSSPDFLARYDAEAKEYERLVALALRRRDGAYDPLDPPQIAYLVEVYKAEALEGDEEARWSSDERDLYWSGRRSVLAQS